MTNSSNPSPTALIATAGLANGSGLASPTLTIISGLSGAGPKSASDSARAATTAAVADPVVDPLTQVSAGVAASVDSTILSTTTSRAVLGVPTDAAAAALGVTDNYLTALVAHIGRIFPADPSSAVQIFQQANAFSNASVEFMQFSTEALETSLSGIPEDITGIDFSKQAFLGESYGSLNAVATSGLSNLVDGGVSDLNALGSDLSNWGRWGDFSDLPNLLTPGQVAAQIWDSGAAVIGGIDRVFVDAGIAPVDFSNEKFSNKIQSTLDSITTVSTISQVQEVFRSTLVLGSLGDLTRPELHIDQNLPLTWQTSTELVEVLQGAGATQFNNLGDLGTALLSFESIEDLGTLSSQTTLMDQETYDTLGTSFGGGSGPGGSVLVRDILGSAAGYGHEVWLPAWDAAVQSLEARGAFSLVETIYGELEAGLAGSYTDPIEMEITDPRTGTVYTDLDSFVGAKVSQIDAQWFSIDLDSNNIIPINDLIANWNATNAAVAAEVQLLNQSDVDVDSITGGNVSSLYGFSQQLSDIGANYEQDAGDWITRVADTTTKAGQAVIATLRASRNNSRLNTAGQQPFQGLQRVPGDPDFFEL